MTMPRLFFANLQPSPPDTGGGGGASPMPTNGKRSWTSVLCEQMVNSTIIAAIAGISSLAVTSSNADGLKAAGIAFGMTFFVEIRKYRKL